MDGHCTKGLRLPRGKPGDEARAKTFLFGCPSVRRLKTTENVMDIEDLVMAGSRQR